MRMSRLGQIAAFVMVAVVSVTATANAAHKRPKVKPEAPGVVQHGKASFYANRFQGKKTASGERMNQNELTAASKVLPLGSTATVTNLETGQSVDVKINDRGPFAPGRVIDLSKSAADAIDLEHRDGLAPVKVEAKPGEQPTSALQEKVKEVAVAQARAERAAQQRIANGKRDGIPAKAGKIPVKTRRSEAAPGL
jgi:rare lipoprotein A